MYKSFNSARATRYIKKYKLDLLVNDRWKKASPFSLNLPMVGKISRDTDPMPSPYFSVYRTIEGDEIRFDNLTYESNSELFLKPQWKELFFSLMFQTFIDEMKIFNRRLLYVSSQDQFAVDQMFNLKFENIKGKEIDVKEINNKFIYSGIFVKKEASVCISQR